MPLTQRLIPHLCILAGLAISFAYVRVAETYAEELKKQAAKFEELSKHIAKVKELEPPSHTRSGQEQGWDRQKFELRQAESEITDVAFRQTGNVVSAAMLALMGIGIYAHVVLH